MQKTTLALQRYGDRENFLRLLNPSTQIAAGRNPERAFFGSAPSLAIMRKAYGEGFPASWLMPQILDLVVFSNSKGTLNEQQMEFLAESIANEYYYLKASELLLFFYRFKTGAYGHFFGVVDPMMIMEALKEFAKERAKAIEKRENEERNRSREEHDKGSVSPQEYCRMKGYPEMSTIFEIMEYERGQEAVKESKVKPPTD